MGPPLISVGANVRLVKMNFHRKRHFIRKDTRGLTWTRTKPQLRKGTDLYRVWGVDGLCFVGL